MTRYRPEPPAAGGGRAVVLVNLGTPDAPTPAALRRYLGEFLADPRVVELPRWLWRLILHGVILRFRPARSARAYARIWGEQGSPLLAGSRALQRRLQEVLEAAGSDLRVHLAMRYGNPSIDDVLDECRAAGVDELLVLPLYPQYSATTTASVTDAIGAYYTRVRRVPALHCVARYWEEPAYLDAVAASIQQDFVTHGKPSRLLFSFHGIPQRYAAAGDPYPQECKGTAIAVAERLGLLDEQWQLVFQSRFGREPWLQPYCDETLRTLGGEGLASVAVVCPGFAADCLETLEEIDMENRAVFQQAGGGEFRYIPALNDAPAHAVALQRVIERHLPQ